MQDIKWMDGQDAKGKYVLELMFQNGRPGYLKNENYEKISNYYTQMIDCPEVAGLTLYGPNGKVIAAKCKTATAA